MRPLVSYDDIIPQPPPINPHSRISTNAPERELHQDRQPPAKKRKGSTNGDTLQPHQTQHSDDPGTPEQTMPYESGGEGVNDNLVVEDAGESRELTHEEIWDDSALVDAWNAASEEYENYHGPEKDWKKEPVNKSPLWYNIPPSPSKRKQKQKSIPSSNLMPTVKGDSPDSRPLNFDTFVPTHDPSLPALPSGSALPDSNYAAQSLAEFSGAMVSQDEAFSRALNAMYWGGYWTAVYHYQRRNNAEKRSLQDDEEDPAQADEEDDVGDDDLMTHPY